jgi:CubicO group peptidase (beta-lactamase class C family)
MSGVSSPIGWLLRRQAEMITRRPVNEWSFTHMNWLLPCETVPRNGHTRPLPGRLRALDIAYEFGGREWRLADLHKRTYTTAFVVLHQGALVHEEYPGYFAGPAARFQLFSLTKSLTSMLIGIALREGVLGDTSDPVTTYLPDLKDSGYDGPTLEHLLDMSSGVGGLEVWDDPESDVNRFTNTVLGGGSVLDVVRSLHRVSEPGERFNYSTIDAQVLGWVLEAASGKSLAQYAAERLWSRIGAEHDAYFWLSRERPRRAVGGGSFNATARDVARLGLLMSHGGALGGQQIVPRDWVLRSRGRNLSHLQVGALGESGLDHYGYANQWWTLGGAHRAFTGIGIHGQYLFVDPEADVVVAKCSAWPTEDDELRDTETIAAMEAIVQHLEG